MSAVVGASIAVLVGLLATFTGLDRGRAFYAAVTIVVAHYYVLFAVVGGADAALLTECAIMSAFVVAAVVGFRRTPWLLVAALAGHGVLDLAHPHLVDNAGVPAWWPDFCLAYDVVAAAYLAGTVAAPVLSAAWARRRTAASSSGKEPASGSSAPRTASPTRGPTSMPTT